jgi:hypothetical protein
VAEVLGLGTPETVRFLLEAHRAHLARLAHELNEFERKVKALDRDYGESRDAWRRAIHLWAGRKGGKRG